MFEELNENSLYRVITIRWADGLQLSSGFIKHSDAHCCVFLLYPIAALLLGEAIQEQTLGWVWDAMYGKSWRMGNEDGSCYVITKQPEVSYPDRSFTTRIATEGSLQLPLEKADTLRFFELAAPEQIITLTHLEFLENLGACQFPL